MVKKILSGRVIKDKNDKTIAVVVKRKYIHPFFGKVITSSKKYYAHDENNKFNLFPKKKNGRSLNDTSTNRIKRC